MIWFQKKVPKLKFLENEWLLYPVVTHLRVLIVTNQMLHFVVVEYVNMQKHALFVGKE